MAGSAQPEGGAYAEFVDSSLSVSGTNIGGMSRVGGGSVLVCNFWEEDDGSFLFPCWPTFNNDADRTKLLQSSLSLLACSESRGGLDKLLSCTRCTCGVDCDSNDPVDPLPCDEVVDSMLGCDTCADGGIGSDDDVGAIGGATVNPEVVPLLVARKGLDLTSLCATVLVVILGTLYAGGGVFGLAKCRRLVGVAGPKPWNDEVITGTSELIVW